MKKIGIIGGGSWGTALASLFASNGKEVFLWARNSDTVNEINNNHTNRKYLGSITLSKNIKATENIRDLITSELLFIVVPSQSVRKLLMLLKSLGVPKNLPFVICSKGIEVDSCKFMSEVFKEVLPDNIFSVLSGPNFADEVAKGLPCCSSFACTDKETGLEMLYSLASPKMRFYFSQDVIGTEVSGAVKNILAIASGIIHGSNLGENARAAVINRGMAEIVRLCVAKGGNPKTVTGLCGVGDVVLTCSSLKSRNMSFGIRIGEGEKLNNIKNSLGVTEGVYSTDSVFRLSSKLDIDMPICSIVYDILYNNKSVNDSIIELFKRPLVIDSDFF